MVWFAYPKKSSKKYTSDITRDTGFSDLGSVGFEPVSIVSIDEDWSALRFRRVEHIKTMTRGFAITDIGKKRTSSAALTDPPGDLGGEAPKKRTAQPSASKEETKTQARVKQKRVKAP